jgi:hypothetical protein
LRQVFIVPDGMGEGKDWRRALDASGPPEIIRQTHRSDNLAAKKKSPPGFGCVLLTPTFDVLLRETKMTAQGRLFGVVVCDGEERLLVLSIRRGPRGDVYVNFPRDGDPQWRPHSSYHESGQHHQKGSGFKALIRHRQKPNRDFCGIENIVRKGIAVDEPRAIGKVVRATDFDEAIEIPLRDLKSEKYRTYLSVDLVDGEVSLAIGDWGKVIRQGVFKDEIPWIIVTIVEE